MKLLRIFIYLVLISATIFGCSPKSEVEKQLDDIEKVIDGIKSRREVENQIIREEINSLKILQDNLESANSDGMREKIRSEIRLKESVIAKSKNNRQNQDRILEELKVKEDSLIRILNNVE